MNKFNLKEEYAKYLKEIFDKYCPEAEIWAYGSRVFGDSHDGSDLDLALISFNSEQKDLAHLKSLINDSDVPFLVDIVDFRLLPDYFKREIEKKYIVFYKNKHMNLE